MKKLCVALALLLLGSACGASSADERTVLVDFSHDEFSSFMISNFPKQVSVAAGDSVVFKQIWTGEPHTVTGGTLVDEMMDDAKHWSPFFEGFEALAAAGVELPNPEAPSGDWQDTIDAVESSDAEPHRTKFLDAYDALVEAGSDLPPRDDIGDLSTKEAVEIVDKESEAIFEEAALPWAIDEDEDGNTIVPQNAGQPCFLERGAPPKEPTEPCEEQEQPTFDGTASYYNSGIIPYEGPQGNTFKVDISPDTDPGSYYFYCAVHGPGQYTEVKVEPEGTEVPNQEAVSRQARKEISTFAEPMLKSFRDARDGEIEIRGETLEGPFAGVTTPTHGSINEFIPEKLEVGVDEPVTWKLMGSDHTVSFDVPEYFPVIRFADDGTVSLNEKLEPPAGGSPDIPEPEKDEILKIDGGTYDGDGFFSSGLFGGEPYAEYTLRFSEPGTYTYACLLHPPMVGTVEVT